MYSAGHFLFLILLYHKFEKKSNFVVSNFAGEVRFAARRRQRFTGVGVAHLQLTGAGAGERLQLPSLAIVRTGARRLAGVRTGVCPCTECI